VHRRYLGFKATYAVRMDDQQVLNVDVATAHDPAYPPGARVLLRFSRDCRLVSV
jgi:hypothetical protein